jgi:hypothetical protein
LQADAAHAAQVVRRVIGIVRHGHGAPAMLAWPASPDRTIPIGLSRDIIRLAQTRQIGPLRHVAHVPEPARARVILGILLPPVPPPERLTLILVIPPGC